ncbi:hypothetical protein BT63DRAFT_429255 [Microthyrium microscopicum]|uniref:Uncharacterized protein n=1 Tax=Microthyrium microscopicum TaxID=703497 RepID=A0A6A6TZ79_9PEZI|nr:hypothetical protein BT63DRAFT_429255 [Microthyrium microscopicum]
MPRDQSFYRLRLRNPATRTGWRDSVQRSAEGNRKPRGAGKKWLPPAWQGTLERQKHYRKKLDVKTLPSFMSLVLTILKDQSRKRKVSCQPRAKSDERVRDESLEAALQ